MALSLCSFGRSFLGCPSGLPRADSPSLRRVLRVFAAARRRWPSGGLRVGLSSVSWMVDGSAGVMLSWDLPRCWPFSARWYSHADFVAEGRVVGDWEDPSFVTGYLPLWWRALWGRL